MSTISDRKLVVRVTNTTETPYLIKINTQFAEFSVVTPEQAKFIKPMDLEILSIIPQGDPDLTIHLNELLRTIKPELQSNTLWFPTPKNTGKIEDDNPIQTRTLEEVCELKKKKNWIRKAKKIPKETFRKIWLDQYTANRKPRTSSWKLSGWLPWLFCQTQSGFWDEHGIEGESYPKRRQCCIQPKSTHVIPPKRRSARWISPDAQVWSYYFFYLFSKFASPIFAQRKPNENLRLLVDLSKMNILYADDYTKNNHPVSTLTDAAQHLAGKSLFCKVDCSQAYHCLQMTDQRSVKMLAFKFSNCY